jgi:hypothetical protein
MPCYNPLLGWRSKSLSDSGKRKIVFNPSEGLPHLGSVKVPCGQCIGCRLERSRQWAVRCVHEASLHDENSFITLTFNDEHIDENGSLRKEDFQKFLKRLRKHIYPQKIKYYHCGEYGDQTQRPHHHACIFGYQFPDLELWKTTNSGVKLYISSTLQKLWKFGYSVIGEVTYESAAYVARYIMKKQNGENGVELYEKTNRIPPYTSMSLKPAIALDWIHKFSSDVYPEDIVILNDKIKGKPPAYYDKYMEEANPVEFEAIKAKRREKALDLEKHPDNSLRRLQIRESVRELKIKQLKRIL